MAGLVLDSLADTLLPDTKEFKSKTEQPKPKVRRTDQDVTQLFFFTFYLFICRTVETSNYNIYLVTSCITFLFQLK